jgi:lysophospholipase L1-like esterase
MVASAPMPTALLVLLAALLIIPLACIGWSARQGFRLPNGRPKQFLATSRPALPVLACVGDSITHGHIGASWVDALGERSKGRATIINAGVNGDVTWNVVQRLDPILACEPDIAVVLIGSNDAMGALNASRARGYVLDKKIPQWPTPAWFEANYRELLQRLLARVATVAAMTLPPLGEHEDAMATLVQQHIEIQRRVCAELGVEVLELHATLRAALPPIPAARPFPETLFPVVVSLFRAILPRYVLGRSWQRISADRGLSATVDHIHLSDKAGVIVAELVGSWVEGALARELKIS